MNRFRGLLWFAGIILLLNFVALMVYGMAIRSTYAFIASNTVFYPLAWLNLISGLAIILLLIREIWTGRKGRP